MTITRVMPAGSPFWARTNTFGHYGGHVSKAEFAGVAALGGDTDLSAADFNRLPTDVAAVSRTIPFCVISYTGRESTADDPLVSYVALPTGVYVGEPYDGGNPPTGFPGVTISGDNAVVTFDSSYSDAYGIAQAFSPTIARPSLNDLTAGLMVRVISISGQTVTTLVVDETPTAQQDIAVTLEVW